jgi:hypothetical protein
MQTQVQSTLLDLVHTFSSLTDNDCEVVAIVTYLVNSGRVRLCGNFAGATIELSSPYPTTPAPSAVNEDSP